MKKVAIAATLSIGIISLSACGGSETIAKTDHGNVTKDELYDAMKAEAGGDVLRQLVTFNILEDKYDVSDEEVDDKEEELKEEICEGYKDLIEQKGLTKENMKKNNKNNLLKQAA